ncbi:hypothetical protein GS501_04710 [Saccharibacter sp. 17.LH.SD]|uniref:hypothetical protein n=1 Tax=Saccharibacter sp. 17.LH.SD TaxID=2689393 RepID=UPI00136C0C57|nr:hypothetical protein [Saccharibacter sp. 17.LH.SD]MXV44347.1 hypothetical protein [Saccharibacter sp. 17.LH.SD]
MRDVEGMITFCNEIVVNDESDQSIPKVAQQITWRFIPSTSLQPSFTHHKLNNDAVMAALYRRR